MATEKPEKRIVKAQEAFVFSSAIWGQTVCIEEPIKLQDIEDMCVPVTVSDFDAGQSVKILLEVPVFKAICEAGLAVLTAKAMTK